MLHNAKGIALAYIAVFTALFCATSYFITGWSFPFDIDLAYGVLSLITALLAIASLSYALVHGKFTHIMIPIITLIFLVFTFCIAANLYDRQYWLRTEDGGPTGASGTCLFWSGAISVYDDYFGSYGVFSGEDKWGASTSNPASPQDDIICTALQTPSLLAIRLNPSYGTYGSYNKTHLTTYVFLTSSLLVATYGMYAQSTKNSSRRR